MACVLRASGRGFDAAAFLAGTHFKPCAVWRKGEARLGRPRSKKHTDSGFNLVVSAADGHGTKRQIRDVLRFLKRHRGILTQLRDSSGIENVILDFGIWQRSGLAQFDHFPAALVSIAGELGMGLELSRYAVDASAPTKPRPERSGPQTARHGRNMRQDSSN
jgi:hypothetical protein